MRRSLIVALLAALALPAAARAETVTESYRVPTVDGAQGYVEVTRDPGVKAPVILTYQAAPLAAATRIADAPVLDARIVASRDHGQIVPTLFDVDPAGTAVPISRGP